MDARKAKDIADNHNKSAKNTVLEAVKAKLRQAANTGNYEIVVTGGLSQEVINELQGEKYTVRIDNIGDEIYTYISFRNPK